MIYRNKTDNVIFLNYPIKKAKGKWVPYSKSSMPVPKVIEEEHVYSNTSRPIMGDVDSLALYDRVKIWHNKWKNELSGITCIEATLTNHPLRSSSMLVIVTKILEGPCPEFIRRNIEVQQSTTTEQIVYSNIICIEIIRRFKSLLERLANKRVVLVRYIGRTNWHLDSIEMYGNSRLYLAKTTDYTESVPEEIKALPKNGEGRISKERYKSVYSRWMQEVTGGKNMLKRLKEDYHASRLYMQTLKQKKPVYIQPRLYVPDVAYSNIESYTFEGYILTVKSKHLHINGYGVYPPVTVKVDYFLTSISVIGFHPHVNGSGVPCFGHDINIEAIIESMNIDWMLTLLNNWLVSYNPDSPWNSLATHVPCKECGNVVICIGSGTLSVVKDEEIYYFCSNECLNKWEKTNDKSKSTSSSETSVLASPGER